MIKLELNKNNTKQKQYLSYVKYTKSKNNN